MTELSIHTPGPWHWVDSGNDQPFPWSGGNEGCPSLRTVAMFGENKTKVRDGKTYTSWPSPKFVLDCDLLENEADARLIAAAPEMLDALNELCKNCYFPTSGNDRFQEAVRNAQSVIAKATGVSHD